MRHALLTQPFGGRFEHDAHGRGTLAHSVHFSGRHRAGIEVRQQTGFLMDDFRYVTEVVECGLKTHLPKRFARGLVAQFGLFSQREERLFAAHLGTLPCNVENLIDGHVGCFQLSGDLGERTVVANVAAQMRQRDEDFA